MTDLPRIALVGRPNVGKSTLFNRISGRRKAITDSRPGSTRDRNYALADWRGYGFELIDTGGLLLGSDDPLLGPAAQQAERAIDEADLVIFLVDGRGGLLPDDEEIARGLRRRGKAVVLAVNKIDQSGRAGWESEFAGLGFDAVEAISAEHGRGIGELLDRAVERIPKVAPPDEESRPLQLALVGRPNSGKSSLLNRLIGEERALVSEVPGTTRDAVDSLLVKGDRRYLLVDTAGIRRTRLLKEGVDHVAVVQARRSIERADVAVLVLDAEAGIREMDATIAGYATESGRGVVVAVNKWDLAPSLGLKQRAFAEKIQDAIKFLSFAPVVFLSARTGSGLTRLLSTVDRVGEARRKRVTTGLVNRVLARAQAGYAPKAAKGADSVRILYGTQVSVGPPTFMISLSHPVDLHFSYKRYLENQLRKEFGFEGTPIQIRVRTRRH
jgi:GTP-binding protein